MRKGLGAALRGPVHHGRGDGVAVLLFHGRSGLERGVERRVRVVVHGRPERVVVEAVHVDLARGARAGRARGGRRRAEEGAGEHRGERKKKREKKKRTRGRT